MQRQVIGCIAIRPLPQRILSIEFDKMLHIPGGLGSILVGIVLGVYTPIDIAPIIVVAIK